MTAYYFNFGIAILIHSISFLIPKQLSRYESLENDMPISDALPLSIGIIHVTSLTVGINLIFIYFLFFFCITEQKPILNSKYFNSLVYIICWISAIIYIPFYVSCPIYINKLNSYRFKGWEPIHIINFIHVGLLLCGSLVLFGISCYRISAIISYYETQKNKEMFAKAKKFFVVVIVIVIIKLLSFYWKFWLILLVFDRVWEHCTFIFIYVILLVKQNQIKYIKMYCCCKKEQSERTTSLISGVTESKIDDDDNNYDD